MGNSLDNITENGVEKLLESDWFDLVVRNKNNLILDFKASPMTLALHKYEDSYQGVCDITSEGYETMVETIKEIIK